MGGVDSLATCARPLHSAALASVSYWILLVRLRQVKSGITLRDIWSKRQAEAMNEASPQSGLGVGCKLCSSSKELRGLDVRLPWSDKLLQGPAVG